jgi:hypothetical protein
VRVSKRFSAFESPYGIARPRHSEAVWDAKGGLSKLIVNVMRSDLPIQRMYEAIFLILDCSVQKVASEISADHVKMRGGAATKRLASTS